MRSTLPRLHLLGAIALASLAPSCSTTGPHEELVRSSIAGETAPPWISGVISHQPGSVSFVGRGGGVNVLDERHAFDEALGHARAQLAQYVATQVVAEACLQDLSNGARFLSLDRHPQGSGERVNQFIRSRVHELADVIVGGVAASDQYWEQWSLSNDLPAGFLNYRTEGQHAIRRYKCWVLARVSQDDIAQYVSLTAQALLNSEEIAALTSELEESSLELAANKANLQEAANLLTAQSWELQRLRERVHYGRRFRLVSEEDCLHYRPHCDFERLHPEWGATEYLLQTDVNTRTVVVEKGCEFCPDKPCVH